MPLEIHAIYEDGVLKPCEPLPFREHEPVFIIVQTKEDAFRATAGLVPWKGDPEVARRLAEDDEFSILEAP